MAPINWCLTCFTLRQRFSIVAINGNAKSVAVDTMKKASPILQV